MAKREPVVLSGLDTVERLSEYPAWDCVTAIYRNILLYKICYYCVWVGVCFVLQSILFTFFYSEEIWEIYQAAKGICARQGVSLGPACPCCEDNTLKISL